MAKQPASEPSSSPLPSQPEDAFTRAAKRRREPTAGLVKVQKKVTTLIPVCTPKTGWYVRASTDPTMSAIEELFFAKEIDDHYYFLEPDMAELVRKINPKLICQRALHLAVTRQANCFLWSNGMENEDGVLNSWHGSGREMIELAKVEWITVFANKQIGAYEYRPADNQAVEPQWPSLTWEQILRLAFRRYIIASKDHPILRAARGER
jgi:hypothetical protein